MKLIIDIPDNEYKYTCERTLSDRTFWDDAIRKGTPLDDVKAEIRARVFDIQATSDKYFDGVDDVMDIVDEIIDKHIGKAESEDT